VSCNSKFLYEHYPIELLIEKVERLSSNEEITMWDIKIECYTPKSVIIIGSEYKNQKVNDIFTT
jgi:fructose-1,6-bisphosphatase